MARVSFIKDDGTEIVIRNGIDNSYDYKMNILFRDDYFATKLWSPEDVEDRLRENGYVGTPEEV